MSRVHYNIECNGVFPTLVDEAKCIRCRKIRNKKVILQPQEFDVEVAGKNGIRVRGTSSHDCMIEFKDGDEWKPLKYVQSLTIELNVDNPLPKIKIGYIVVS